jgi:hypothetical protein
MARAWYTYDGSGDVNQPSNYNLTTVKPACRTGAQMCAIYAVYGGLNPFEITEALQVYIANGLATGLPQPQTPAGAKKFVYLKSTL